MTDDRDRLLDVIGIALVLSVIVGFAVIVVVAMHASAPSQRETTPPNVTWSFQRVNATHVRIRHDGGESIVASNLLVTVNGNKRSVTWVGLITKGDAGVVAASQGELVQLFWTGGEGGRQQVASWRVSSATSNYAIVSSEALSVGDRPAGTPTRPPRVGDRDRGWKQFIVH